MKTTIIFLLLSFGATAQSSTVESLESMWQTGNKTAAGVWIRNNLGLKGDKEDADGCVFYYADVSSYTICDDGIYFGTDLQEYSAFMQQLTDKFGAPEIQEEGILYFGDHVWISQNAEYNSVDLFYKFYSE